MIVTPQEIMRLRQRGKRPAAMILLSLIGELEEENPVLVIEDHQRIESLDFRFLHSLEVSILTESKQIDFRRLFALADTILAIDPRYLAIVVDDMPTGFVLVESGYRVQPMRRFTLREECEWEAAA